MPACVCEISSACFCPAQITHTRCGVENPRCAQSTSTPVPHKAFSDLYEKMSGKGASASETHRSSFCRRGRRSHGSGAAG